MVFLEKWQLANEFSVNKVNYYGNTLVLGMTKYCLAKFFKINYVKLTKSSNIWSMDYKAS